MRDNIQTVHSTNLAIVDCNDGSQNPSRWMDEFRKIKRDTSKAIAGYHETNTVADQVLEYELDQQDIVDVAIALSAEIERCRQNRLRVSRPYSTHLKSVEGIFKGVETSMKASLESILLKLGQTVPNDQLERVPTTVVSRNLDWERLGPHFSEADILRAAKKLVTATGENELEGIAYRSMAKLECLS